MHNKYCVVACLMPFRCVQNPLGDPFGGPVQPKQDSLETANGTEAEFVAICQLCKC